MSDERIEQLEKQVKKLQFQLSQVAHGLPAAEHGALARFIISYDIEEVEINRLHTIFEGYRKCMKVANQFDIKMFESELRSAMVDDSKDVRAYFEPSEVVWAMYWDGYWRDVCKYWRDNHAKTV